MSSAKKAFKELKEATAKGSSTFSMSSLVNLTEAMINDKEYSYTSYSKKGDSYETEEKNPFLDLRKDLSSLQKKHFGSTEAESNKWLDIEFPKSFSKHLVECGQISTKTYLETGKTYRLPATSPEDAAMKISIKRVPEEVRDTNKIVKDETTGEYRSIPTGNTVKTAAHNIIVARNTVNPWSKTIVNKK